MLLIYFFTTLSFAQIGINTTNPKATLELVAQNPTGNSTNVDGLIIPRVDRQRAQNMTSIETSTIIYIYDETTGSATGVATEINQKGFYFFNGTKWTKFVFSSSTALDIGYIVGWSSNTNPPDYLIPISGGTFDWSDYPDLQVLHSTNPIQFIQSSNSTVFTLKDINTNGRFLRGNTVAGVEETQSTALPTISFTTNLIGSHNHSFDPAVINSSSSGSHQHDLNMVSKDDGNFSNANAQFPTGDAAKYNGTNHNIQVESSGLHLHTIDIPSTVSSSDGNHSHVISGGGDAETRPLNISVIWCIKGKPTNSGGNIVVNNGNITNLTTNGISGISTLTGSTLNIPQYSTSTIGDIKAGIQLTDHNGWIRLNGRAKSTLTATQQIEATALGIGLNLPNAVNSYLTENGTALGSVSGNNIRVIAQNQLPNLSLTTPTNGAHTHQLRQPGELDENQGYPASGFNGVWSTDRIGGSTSSNPVISNGDHSHTIQLNGGVTQQNINIQPQSLSVNMFIFLGN